MNRIRGKIKLAAVLIGTCGVAYLSGTVGAAKDADRLAISRFTTS